MRITPSVMFAMVVIGCAGRQTSPPPSASPPLPTRSTMDPNPDVKQHTPRVLVEIPKGWLETDPSGHDPGADLALVHESGGALILITLRTTDGRGLASHAEDILVKLSTGENVTSSGILTTASGDLAMFSWNRHRAPHRTEPAHGKVLLVRFPTTPERMAVISGAWGHGHDDEFASDFKRVAKSVALQ